MTKFKNIFLPVFFLAFLIVNIPNVAHSSDNLPSHLPRLDSGQTEISSRESLPPAQFGRAIERKFISGKNSMLAFFTINKDGVIPWHNHEAEQITHVLKGSMIFTVGADRKEFHLKEGDILVIPSNIPHKAVALEDTFEVDVFSPIRKDWLDGSDNYLRNLPSQQNNN